MKCPVCGFKKNIPIKQLTTNGFSCAKCSDGVSYPNKFIYNVLECLNIKFSTEKTFKWSCGKRYDFYIQNSQCIIEAHGLQHYEGNGFKGINSDTVVTTLKEQQENDIFKKKLAKENGIKYYFEIDCRYSEMSWIKNFIIESELPNLLNFLESDINWDKCDENSQKNLLYTACDYYQKYKNTQIVSNIIGVHINTIIKYLKIGNRLGLCEYDAIQMSKQALIKMQNNNKKEVVCEGKIFNSIKECAAYYNVRLSYLSQFLNKHKAMPLIWYNRKLHLKDVPMSSYKKSNKYQTRQVICDDIFFKTITKCADHFNVKLQTMSVWLNGKTKMPQKFKDLGLRYATEEEIMNNLDNKQHLNNKQ